MWLLQFNGINVMEHSGREETPRNLRLQMKWYQECSWRIPTVEDRSLRHPKTQEPKQEKHQMASRQDYASTKRLKNESFEYMDITIDYESPPEFFGEITHEKQYSSPRAMKSDYQTKVKLKHQDIDEPKKEAMPEWVINLMSSVKWLEQKVDNTMVEVNALKKTETAKQELQTVIKSKKVGMKIMLILLIIKVFKLWWWKRLFKFKDNVKFVS
jgi:hypothetical protein